MRKSLMQIIVLLVVIIFCAFQCEEQVDFVTADCVEVIAIESICGETVLQIVNPNFHYLGETWNTYSNVFYTDINCREFELPANQASFFVRLSAWSDSIVYNPACVRCEATIGYSGTKRYIVDKIDVCLSE